MTTQTSAAPHLYYGVDDNSYVRTISRKVFRGQLAIPPVEGDSLSHLLASSYLPDTLGVGDIWPINSLSSSCSAFSAIHAAAVKWAAARGLSADMDQASVTTLVCRGAPFHCDAEGFPAQVFGVVWLGGNQMEFLAGPHVVPLRYGTIILFDSALPHAVMPKGETIWDPSEPAFNKMPKEGQLFLSFNIALSDSVSERMGIRVQDAPAPVGMPVIQRRATTLEVNPFTGEWCPA